jgi:pimeloyl-ACP methyl ester carboxylesterase
VTYPPHEPLGYDELLPRVLDRLPTSEPFVLLAESFSGPLALMASARSPAGLRGVILCASFVRNPLPPGSSVLRQLVRGFWFRASPEFARSWALLGGYATPALRRLSGEAIEAVSPHVLAHRVRAVLRVDVRRELEACRVPVLYLRGRHDRVVSRRNGDEVLARSASAKVVELPAPHFVLQTQPAAAAAAVSKFVAALPSDPPLERTATAM